MGSGAGLASDSRPLGICRRSVLQACLFMLGCYASGCCISLYCWCQASRRGQGGRYLVTNTAAGAQFPS